MDFAMAEKKERSGFHGEESGVSSQLSDHGYELELETVRVTIVENGFLCCPLPSVTKRSSGY
jgi:hypothetical protein